MPSARTPKPDPQFDFIKDDETRTSKTTKRAKDKQNSAAKAKDGKAREAIANDQKRSMQRHVQRKSRVKPLTRSSGRGRGNAQTRRRKESKD